MTKEVLKIKVKSSSEPRNAMRQATRTRDYKAGQADARFGIYDKWYRYNHGDSGSAYDKGWRSVPDKDKKWENLTILNA